MIRVEEDRNAAVTNRIWMLFFFAGRIRQNVNKRPHDQGPLAKDYGYTSRLQALDHLRYVMWLVSNQGSFNIFYSYLLDGPTPLQRKQRQTAGICYK